jgi:hypothetical protein
MIAGTSALIVKQTALNAAAFNAKIEELNAEICRLRAAETATKPSSTE